MLKILYLDMYYLLDPRSSLSYVTSFVAVHFGSGPQCLSIPFFVSTMVGDSVVVKRFYRGVWYMLVVNKL